MVTVVTIWREIGGAKWGCFAILLQLMVGYGLALVSFRIGIYLWAGAPFGVGQVAALLAIAFVLYAVFRPAPGEKHS